MKKLRSTLSPTVLVLIGCQNEGHPVPLSYFASEANSASSHPAQRYRPRRFSPFSGLEKGGSVVVGTQDAIVEDERTGEKKPGQKLKFRCTAAPPVVKTAVEAAAPVVQEGVKAAADAAGPVVQVCAKH